MKNNNAPANAPIIVNANNRTPVPVIVNAPAHVVVNVKNEPVAPVNKKEKGMLADLAVKFVYYTVLATKNPSLKNTAHSIMNQLLAIARHAYMHRWDETPVFGAVAKKIMNIAHRMKHGVPLNAAGNMHLENIKPSDFGSLSKKDTQSLALVLWMVRYFIGSKKLAETFHKHGMKGKLVAALLNYADIAYPLYQNIREGQPARFHQYAGPLIHATMKCIGAGCAKVLGKRKRNNNSVAK